MWVFGLSFPPVLVKFCAGGRRDVVECLQIPQQEAVFMARARFRFWLNLFPPVSELSFRGHAKAANKTAQ